MVFAALAASAPAQEATSTFGHARARELAELGRLPGARDIVVRDIVNYHRHRLPLPKAGEDVALDVRFDASSADREGSVLLQVGYATSPQGDRSLARPCSVALVVDCSGSMQERGKMDQVKRGLCAFVGGLRDDDEVLLIAFSEDARVAAERRPCGRDRRWLLCAIDALQPERGTNLHAGLMLGLQRLQDADGGDGPAAARARRLVLLTDGIANHGVTDPAAILADARPFTAAAVDISTIGVGENLDVALLQRLAHGTRGLFHFVADEQDVQKVFVQELDSLLSAVARRPRLRITLPPCLSVDAVFHEGVQQRRGEVRLDLPDLNAGATGIVLLRCLRDRHDTADRTVEAELAFDSARLQRPCTERASVDLAAAAAVHRAEVDLEVRKNAAIAVLAQGLRELAEASDARRWADADRALRRARDEAQRLFPGDDQDLQRVRDMAAGHARTLQQHVDRFRDQ